MWRVEMHEICIENLRRAHFLNNFLRPTHGFSPADEKQNYFVRPYVMFNVAPSTPSQFQLLYIRCLWRGGGLFFSFHFQIYYFIIQISIFFHYWLYFQLLKLVLLKLSIWLQIWLHMYVDPFIIIFIRFYIIWQLCILYRLEPKGTNVLSL